MPKINLKNLIKNNLELEEIKIFLEGYRKEMEKKVDELSESGEKQQLDSQPQSQEEVETKIEKVKSLLHEISVLQDYTNLGRPKKSPVETSDKPNLKEVLARALVKKSPVETSDKPESQTHKRYYFENDIVLDIPQELSEKLPSDSEFCVRKEVLTRPKTAEGVIAIESESEVVLKENLHLVKERTSKGTIIGTTSGAGAGALSGAAMGGGAMLALSPFTFGLSTLLAPTAAAAGAVVGGLGGVATGLTAGVIADKFSNDKVTEIESEMENFLEEYKSMLEEKLRSYQDESQRKYYDNEIRGLKAYIENPKDWIDKAEKVKEWLDNKYPQEKRNEVDKIELNESTLEGKLDLGGFARLSKICIDSKVDENKLVIRNKPEEAEIIFLNAQKYINDKYHTKEEKKEETKLNISNKNLEGGVDFTHFTNLKEVSVSGDLQLDKIGDGKQKELIFRVIEQEKQKNITKLEIKKEVDSNEVKKAPDIPNIVLLNLRDRKSSEENTGWELHEKYKNVYPNDNLVKAEIRESKPTDLPKKLYERKVNKVLVSETIDKDLKDSRYATLSYVCNDGMQGHKEWGMSDGQKFLLSPSSTKALNKAIKTCETLDIDYLWMDKLCINQNDPEEKAEEVRKMYQNYNNSAVTLISINKSLQKGSSQEWDHDSLKVLEEIVDSEWFTRSWTYQEGWLSKHTIFMFKFSEQYNFLNSTHGN